MKSAFTITSSLYRVFTGALTPCRLVAYWALLRAHFWPKVESCGTIAGVMTQLESLERHPLLAFLPENPSNSELWELPEVLAMGDQGDSQMRLWPQREETDEDIDQSPRERTPSDRTTDERGPGKSKCVDHEVGKGHTGRGRRKRSSGAEKGECDRVRQRRWQYTAQTQ